MKKNLKQSAFTLIELLVVVSIISLISSSILATLKVARDKSKIARVQGDLLVIRSAIALMAIDTEKWPNGCTNGSIITAGMPGSGNEVTLLDATKGGLVSKPTASGINPGSGCGWTAADVAKWRGPYISASLLIDPWKDAYWFDNDYEQYRDCPTPYANSYPTIAAISSNGPNKIGGASGEGYDCDDVFLYIVGN